MVPAGRPSAVQRYWSNPAWKKSARSYLSRLTYGVRLSSVLRVWNWGTSQGMISATSGGVPPATSEESLSRNGCPEATFSCSIFSPSLACWASNAAASFWLASSQGPGVDQYIHCKVVPGLTPGREAPCPPGPLPPPGRQAPSAAPATTAPPAAPAPSSRRRASGAPAPDFGFHPRLICSPPLSSLRHCTALGNVCANLFLGATIYRSGHRVRMIRDRASRGWRRPGMERTW